MKLYVLVCCILYLVCCSIPTDIFINVRLIIGDPYEHNTYRTILCCKSSLFIFYKSVELVNYIIIK